MFLTDYNDIFGELIEEQSSSVQEVTVNMPPPSDAVRSPRHQMYSDLPTPSNNPATFQSIAGFQPLSASGQPGRNTYIPPSTTDYAAAYQQQQQNQHMYSNSASQPYQSQRYTENNFSNMSAMMQQQQLNDAASSLGLTVNESKRGRRESAMMGVGIGLVGQRQPHRPIRDNSGNRLPPAQAQPAFT
jgi:RalA-binding protein 1